MDHPVISRLVQVIVQNFLAQAIVLFMAAGRLDWPAAWAYLSIYLCSIGINFLVTMSGQKDVIAERAQLKKGARAWDMVILLVLGIFILGTLAVAGLDFRSGCSPLLPVPVAVVAAVVVAAGYLLFTWAMASNKYFSAIVRIQKDRHHEVQTGGPYLFVRHPGYLGMIVYTLATPLLLGSLWAPVPAGMAAVAIVVRTALEDRTLQCELEGYKEHAAHVPYRLLPGVW